MEQATLNQKIKNFKFISTDSTLTSFESLLNKITILFFYPKDNTPGCTQENLDFKKFYNELNPYEINLIGISRDSLLSHQRFSEKHQLPFPLIADENEELCRYFNVIKTKKLYGRERLSIERSTFVINESGILVKEWRKIKVPLHAEFVMSYIKSNYEQLG